MEENDIDWVLDFIFQIITSPEFRNPIKDFIDENCNSFIGIDENTFEQGGLFKEFTLLVETLLQNALKDYGVTEEMFLLAAKKGLESESNAKYFEQLISFTNYEYFKSMMTKRNLQLEAMAYNQIKNNVNNGKENLNNKIKKEDQIKLIEEINKKAEEDEIQAALKMSLALEEEKRKLQELEELDLKKAIKNSLVEKPIDNPIAIEMKKEHKSQILFQPNEKENKNEQNNENIFPSIIQKRPDYKEIELPNKKIQIEQNIKSNENLVSSFFNDDIPKNTIKDLEEERAKKLMEYKQMIIERNKELRKQEQIDDDNEKDKKEPVLTEDQKRRMELRKQLALKLKKCNFENK